MLCPEKNCLARSTLYADPVAITKQTVTDMTAKEIQCNSFNQPEASKETHYSCSCFARKNSQTGKSTESFASTN